MSTKQILKYILRKMSRFPGASWGLSMVYRTLTSGGWIIRTCNLLVLDSFGYKLPLPTPCKRKLGEKNPFDDVTRRQILELLRWQRIMRTGLRSVVFCSAIVIASAKPGQKYSRQLWLKLSVPQIYLCQQMRGCNFKHCHSKDLSPDTRNVSSSLLQRGQYLVNSFSD